MTRTRVIAITVLAVAALAWAVAASFVSAPVANEGAPPTPAVIANPYDSVRQFMEGIYAAERSVAPTPQHAVRAVVVPHHLLSSEAMAAGIRALEGQSFTHVVLLSPDHFHRCPTVLCMTDATYETPFGDVAAPSDLAASLRTSPLVTDEVALFREEHGVHAVMPFIAHRFPGVPVVPLALSQRVPWRPQREDVLALLEKAMGPGGVLVVSSDFSHYLPLSAAEAADERTAAALFAKDLDAVASLDNPAQSDCPGCLWLLATLADRGGFYNPSVLLHTNSATILRDERVPETTSHFAIAWYQNARLSGDDLAAAGDVTVTRGVPEMAAAAGAWWAGGGPRLVNLEGPLSGECVDRENPYVFCNALAAWRHVADAATLWGVENNHMLDLGAEGRLTTVRLLREEGEVPVGADGWRGDGIRVFALTTVINPVAGARGAGMPQAHAAVVKALGADDAALDVVLVHGGEEFRALTTDADTRLWDGLIDAGADAVLVAHSHVPGDVRIYKGKPIFRGLGNFLFDQADAVATSTAKLVRLRKGADGRVRFETALFPTR